MHGPSKHDDDQIDAYTEHLVVLQVAGDSEGRKRELLYDALSDIDRDAVDEAIQSLQRAQLVVVRGDRLHRSPALERIDRLDMIGI